MRHISEELTVVNIIGPAVLAADNTPVAIDMAGQRDGCLIHISIGIGGITFTGVNKIEFKVTHSNDVSTGYTDVTAADILGESGAIVTGIVKSLVAAHAAAADYKFGYRGGKRYIKVLADFSGTHATGTPIHVAAILRGGILPAPDQP